jgi:hypothetical protein
VVKEDNGAAEAVKEADGVAVADNSEYRHPIGIISVTYTLVFTNNYCISTFYFCGTRLFVERVYPCNPFLCGTRLFVERIFLWNALLMFLWNDFLVERVYLWNGVIKKSPPRRRW